MVRLSGVAEAEVLRAEITLASGSWRLAVVPGSATALFDNGQRPVFVQTPDGVADEAYATPRDAALAFNDRVLMARQTPAVVSATEARATGLHRRFHYDAMKAALAMGMPVHGDAFEEYFLDRPEGLVASRAGIFRRPAPEAAAPEVVAPTPEPAPVPAPAAVTGAVMLPAAPIFGSWENLENLRDAAVSYLSAAFTLSADEDAALARFGAAMLAATINPRALDGFPDYANELMRGLTAAIEERNFGRERGDEMGSPEVEAARARAAVAGMAPVGAVFNVNPVLPEPTAAEVAAAVERLTAASAPTPAPEAAPPVAAAARGEAAWTGLEDVRRAALAVIDAIYADSDTRNDDEAALRDSIEAVKNSPALTEAYGPWRNRLLNGVAVIARRRAAAVLAGESADSALMGTMRVAAVRSLDNELSPRAAEPAVIELDERQQAAVDAGADVTAVGVIPAAVVAAPAATEAPEVVVVPAAVAVADVPVELTPLQKAQAARRASILAKSGPELDERLGRGFRPVVIQTEDTGTRARLEKEQKSLRRRKPSGNAEHPDAKRLAEVQALLDGPLKKPEYRLVNDEGLFKMVNKTEFDYCVAAVGATVERPAEEVAVEAVAAAEAGPAVDERLMAAAEMMAAARRHSLSRSPNPAFSKEAGNVTANEYVGFAGRLLSAIESRHPALMHDTFVTGINMEGAYKVFQKETGLKLSRVQKERAEVIRGFVGAEAYDGMLSERERAFAARRDENRRQERERERRTVLDKPARWNLGEGVVNGTTAGLFDDLLKRGYTDLREGKRGALPCYVLVNGKGEGHLFFGRVELEYVQQRLVELVAAGSLAAGAEVPRAVALQEDGSFNLRPEAAPEPVVAALPADDEAARPADPIELPAAPVPAPFDVTASMGEWNDFGPVAAGELPRVLEGFPAGWEIRQTEPLRFRLDNPSREPATAPEGEISMSTDGRAWRLSLVSTNPLRRAAVPTRFSTPQEAAREYVAAVFAVRHPELTIRRDFERYGVENFTGRPHSESVMGAVVARQPIAAALVNLLPPNMATGYAPVAETFLAPAGFVPAAPVSGLPAAASMVADPLFNPVVAAPPVAVEAAQPVDDGGALRSAVPVSLAGTGSVLRPWQMNLETFTRFAAVRDELIENNPFPEGSRHRLALVDSLEELGMLAASDPMGTTLTGVELEMFGSEAAALHRRVVRGAVREGLGVPAAVVAGVYRLEADAAAATVARMRADLLAGATPTAGVLAGEALAAFPLDADSALLPPGTRAGYALRDDGGRVHALLAISDTRGGWETFVRADNRLPVVNPPGAGAFGAGVNVRQPSPEAALRRFEAALQAEPERLPVTLTPESLARVVAAVAQAERINSEVNGLEPVAPVAALPVEALPVEAPAPVAEAMPVTVGESPEVVAAAEEIESEANARAPGNFPNEELNATLAASETVKEAPAVAVAPVRELTEDERDFFFERDEQLAPAGRVSRIRANLAAIRLSKTIAEEGRLATPDEKRVLAAYAGWGADKEVFNEGMASFRDQPEWARNRVQEYPGWEKTYGAHYNALKALLTPDEWRRASASTLNAHYTSEELSHGLWDIARRAGFRGGKVLEPAAGSCRIIGAMPTDLRERSTVVAVEPDSLSARLAAQTYPQVRVVQDTFQDAAESGELADHDFDLVITNVPFSDTPPARQVKDDDEPQYNLHNSIIRGTLDKLKPGGLSIIITSSSTLQNNADQRAALSTRLQLLGAVRLPNNAFQAGSNTVVTTDVLLLRKPDVNKVVSQEFRSVVPVALDPAVIADAKPPINRPWEKPAPVVENALVNEYFAFHPEMVLGVHSMSGSMYGNQDERGQYTLLPDKSAEGTLVERFAAAVARLPEDVPNPTLVEERAAGETLESEREQDTIRRLRAVAGLKPGTFALPAEGENQQAGVVPLAVGIVTPGGYLRPPPWRQEDGTPNLDYKLPRGYNPERADALAVMFAGLRQNLKNVILTDLNPVATEEDSARVRARLLESYEGFTAAYGKLNATPALVSLMRQDPELGAVLALEKVTMEVDPARPGRTKPRIEESAILTQRTLYPTPVPERVDSVEDGITVSLSQKGRVEADYIARLMGREEDAAGVKRLILQTGLVFENPQTGLMEGRTQYLSGNVVQKLAQARKAQKKAEAAALAATTIGGDAAGRPVADVTGVSFARNISELEGVQPAPVPFDQINAGLGATWIPSDLVSDFAGEVLGQGKPLPCQFFPQMGQWLVSTDYRSTAQVTTIYGVGGKDGVKILDAALNRKHITITVKSDGRVTVDQGATNQANARADQLKEQFQRYIKATPESRARIETAFNHAFNNNVLPEYKGDYLTFPGLCQGADGFVPRGHQRDGVARVVTEQCGMLAHGVGFGKTLEFIMAAAESKRTGLANKPLMVCRKNNYSQFVATIRAAYPQLNILVSDEENMSARNRASHMSRIATGEWDMVVCTHQHLTMMPNRPQTHIRFLNDEIDNLRAAHDAMGRHKMARHLVRKTEKKIEQAQEKLKVQMDRMEARQDNCLNFEDLGVDLMLVDEVHDMKAMPFETQMTDIKGVPTAVSQRGTSMLMKAQYIQEQRGDGRGVIGGTGTPVTNTMAEAWNMTRLCDPRKLRDFSVPSFDQFVAAFCEQVTALELNESSGRWRYATRLAKFVNGPQFINFVRAGWDVKMDSGAVSLDVPKLKGGEIQLRTVELTDATADVQDEITAIYDRWDELEGEEKIKLAWVPLVLMGVGMAAAIDPRMINPSAPDEENSLVNDVVRETLRVYHETQAEHGRKGAQAIFLDRYRPTNTSLLNSVMGADFRITELDFDEPTEKKAVVQEDEDEENTFKAVEEEEAAVPAAAGNLDPSHTMALNLYEEIRRKLVLGNSTHPGIPAKEIVLATDVKNAAEQKMMFDRVDRCEATVIIGSTERIGVGANFQTNLCWAHHVDPPRRMTPADLEQRNGRIIRQGNTFPEVGVTYYGMKDTATPGIYHRLQRKDAFVKQALAGKGVGLEFEDTGAVRLEEMKSCLVSDKRQLQRAELMVAIREQRVQEDTIYDRRRSLSWEVGRSREYVEKLHGKLIPDAEALASIIAARVVLPHAADKPTTLQMRAAGEDAGGEVFSDEFKAIEKHLDKQVQDWKKLKFGDSHAVQELGSINLNGLDIYISKQLQGRVQEQGTGDWITATKLMARVPSPLGGSTPLMEAKFGSAEALFKIVASVYDTAQQKPETLRRELAQYEKRIAPIQQQLNETLPFDDTELNRLKDALRALEKDMSERPYKRLRKGEVAEEPGVPSVVNADALPALPDFNPVAAGAGGVRADAPRSTLGDLRATGMDIGDNLDWYAEPEVDGQPEDQRPLTAAGQQMLSMHATATQQFSAEGGVSRMPVARRLVPDRYESVSVPAADPTEESFTVEFDTASV